MSDGVFYSILFLGQFLMCFSITYYFSRRGHYKVAAVLILIAIIVTVSFYLISLGAAGWDSLGFFMMAFFFGFLPAAYFAFGTFIGWLRNRRG